MSGDFQDHLVLEGGVMKEDPQLRTEHVSFRMSWAAYVKPILILIVGVSLGIKLLDLNVWFIPKSFGWLTWIGLVVLLLSVGRFVYRVLAIRSLVLYTNDKGVWVYRGLIPWSKGVSGVKWDVLDDAIYSRTFFSWLSKSYTVRIGHRVSITREISLSHIHRGNEAVESINALHQKMISGLGIVFGVQQKSADSSSSAGAHLPPVVSLHESQIKKHLPEADTVSQDLKDAIQSPPLHTPKVLCCAGCGSSWPVHYPRCLKCGGNL